MFYVIPETLLSPGNSCSVSGKHSLSSTSLKMSSAFSVFLQKGADALRESATSCRTVSITQSQPLPMPPCQCAQTRPWTPQDLCLSHSSTIPCPPQPSRLITPLGLTVEGDQKIKHSREVKTVRDICIKELNKV